MLMGETYRLLPHRNRSSLTVGGCVSATERHDCHGEGPKMATRKQCNTVPKAMMTGEETAHTPPAVDLVARLKGCLMGPKRAPRAKFHSRLLLFIIFLSPSQVRYELR